MKRTNSAKQTDLAMLKEGSIITENSILSQLLKVVTLRQSEIELAQKIGFADLRRDAEQYAVTAESAKSEIVALQAEIVRTKAAEAAAIQDQINALAMARADYLSQLSLAHASTQTLKVDLTLAEDRAFAAKSQTEDQKQGFKSELTALKSELHRYVGRATALENELAEIHVRHSRRLQRVAELEDNVVDLERTLSLRDTTVNSSAKAIRELQIQLDNILAQNQQLSTKLVDACSKLDATKDSLKSSKFERNGLAQAKAALMAQAELDGAELASHKKRLAQIEAAKAVSESAHLQSAETAKSLGEQLKSSHAERAALDNANLALIAKVEAAQAELHANRAELAKSVTSRAEREAALSVARSAIAASEASHTTKLAETLRAHAEREGTTQAQLVDTQASAAFTKTIVERGTLLARMAPRAVIHRRARAVLRSGMFEAAFYKHQFPQVLSKASDLAAASHWIRTGYVARARPNKMFDAHWYLDHYEDVRHSGADPLLHYAEYGWREGRDPGPDFSTTYYLATNADVAKSGGCPLVHYLAHGQHEGRRAKPKV